MQETYSNGHIFTFRAIMVAFVTLVVIVGTILFVRVHVFAVTGLTLGKIDSASSPTFVAVPAATPTVPSTSTASITDLGSASSSTFVPLIPIAGAVGSAYDPVNISHGPIISLDFDDGFESAYKNALPIIHAAGFRTSQYIITHLLGRPLYMTSQEVLAMQTAGDEIGAHTQTHPHLADLSLALAQKEIEGSKQDLLSMGITSVATFAYPYGSHNTDVEQLVKNAGFIDARITGPGFNDANTDPYALYYYGIFSSTTPQMVETAIDAAAKNKKWLILVFHRVDETPVSPEDTTHELVQQVVDYIREKNIPVVTNAQGFSIMKNIAP